MLLHPTQWSKSKSGWLNLGPVRPALQAATLEPALRAEELHILTVDVPGDRCDPSVRCTEYQMIPSRAYKTPSIQSLTAIDAPTAISIRLPVQYRLSHLRSPAPSIQVARARLTACRSGSPLLTYNLLPVPSIATIPSKYAHAICHCHAAGAMLQKWQVSAHVLQASASDARLRFLICHSEYGVTVLPRPRLPPHRMHKFTTALPACHMQTMSAWFLASLSGCQAWDEPTRRLAKSLALVKGTSDAMSRGASAKMEVCGLP